MFTLPQPRTKGRPSSVRSQGWWLDVADLLLRTPSGKSDWPSRTCLLAFNSKLRLKQRELGRVMAKLFNYLPGNRSDEPWRHVLAHLQGRPVGVRQGAGWGTCWMHPAALISTYPRWMVGDRACLSPSSYPPRAEHRRPQLHHLLHHNCPTPGQEKETRTQDRCLPTAVQLNNLRIGV